MSIKNSTTFKGKGAWFRLAAIPLAIMANSSYAETKTQLEVIEVTAQKRTQNIQSVPVAVTAATGEQLADKQVLNIENISAITPSVTFTKTNMASSSSNIQIRGLGTIGNSRSFEGAVGVFIDDIYRTRSGAALSQFLDIDQLQVLRGPQGTLFGKNTSAGAILLESVKPDTDDVSGFVEGRIGSDNFSNFSGAVNVPLSDIAAFRIAGMTNKRDGYINDPNGGTLNDAKSEGVKGQFLLEPTDNTSFRLAVDYSKEDNNCCYATVNVVDGPLQPLIDAMTAANGLKVPSKDISDREGLNSQPTSNIVTDEGVAFYADVAFDMGTLKYTGAVRKYEVKQRDADADFSGADIFSLDESFTSDFQSHELNFSGELTGDIPANYIVGLFYSNEDLSMGRDLHWGSQAQMFWDAVFGASGLPAGVANAAPGNYAMENMSGGGDSVAVYTHWDFSLNEEFNLVLGGRYSKDEKDGAFSTDYLRDALFDPLSLAGVMPGVEYDEDYDDDSISGSVALQYTPTREMMYYFSYSRGYKSGGVNIDVNAGGSPGSLVLGTPGTPGDPIFESETTDGYELGAKISWLDDRARSNVAFFYNELSDLQVAQFKGILFGIDNASDASSYGLEIEQKFILTDELMLSGDVVWLPKSEYGDEASLEHLSGRRFALAPKVAGNLAINGDFEITDNINLTARLGIQYRGEVYTTASSNDKEDAVTLVNASIGVDFPDYDLKVQFYVQNLTDETYILQHFNTPLQATDRDGYVNDPRTYGVTARYSF